MKKTTIATLLLTATVSTDAIADMPPTYNYNKDIRIGLEATSVGNYSLAQAFLEDALDAHESSPWYKAWFRPVLTKESREAAVEALYEVYWETGQHDKLFDHIQTYNPMPSNLITRVVDRERVNQVYSEHLDWYCQMLDRHNRYYDAQACWNKIAHSEESKASIRAAEFYEVILGD